MSDIIRLLPDSVANQIAAGEVIQRPASVVKELVENAIDAGASRITVEVEDAGRTAIIVTDDGRGMTPTDARLAFERHSTSKISKADDLYALHTMGFRGEALASIVAVAKVQLLTRTAQQEIGTRLTMAASRVESQEPATCAVGSRFEVSSLFYNLPARRKFLKSNSTELNNVTQAMERIVLVYPDVSFTLIADHSTTMSLRPAPLRQRIQDVFSRRQLSDLLPLEVDTSLCKIRGYVGSPEAARKKAAHQFFFVNGRFMRHPGFHKAVSGAYDRLVPAGMYVPYFVYLTVDPQDIDVNIHPTKTEIKFENEQAVWQILSAAVKDAIGRFCQVPTIDFDTTGQIEMPLYNPGAKVEAPRVSVNPQYNPFSASAGGSGAAPADWQTLFGPSAEAEAEQPEPDLFGRVGLDGQKLSAPSADVIEDKSPVHYQYKGRYIMTAVKSGLMVIDQYRADLRIRYEQYMSRLAERKSSTQRLLFPEVLAFSPSDGVTLRRILPDLEAIGFELQPMGHDSYAIGGVPAGLEDVNPVELLQGIVTGAGADGTADTAAIHHSLALNMARSSALPYGEVLTNEGMASIVDRLFACQNVNYTPDGRPIVAIIGQREIDGRF